MERDTAIQQDLTAKYHIRLWTRIVSLLNGIAIALISHITAVLLLSLFSSATFSKRGNKVELRTA